MEDHSNYESYGACGGWDGSYHGHSWYNGGVEIAGTYYYDVNSSQAVASPSCGMDSERTRECHTDHLSGPRLDRSGQELSDSRTAGEGPRRGTQDRSRRKGEPFRFDRRPRNRARVAPNDAQREVDDGGWSNVPPHSDVSERTLASCNDVVDKVPINGPQSTRRRQGKKQGPDSKVLASSESPSCDDVMVGGHDKFGSRGKKTFAERRKARRRRETDGSQVQAATGDSELQGASFGAGPPLDVPNNNVHQKCTSLEDCANRLLQQPAEDGSEPSHGACNSRSAHKGRRSRNFCSNAHWQQRYWDNGERTVMPQNSRNHERWKNLGRDRSDSHWPGSRRTELSQTDQNFNKDSREPTQRTKHSEKKNGRGKNVAYDCQHSSSSPSCDSHETDYRRQPNTSTRQRNTGKSARSYPKSLSSHGSYPQVPRPDDAPQKDRMTDQLLSGEYECMVCCDRVRGSESIWSCSSCYHIFHLSCARKWALSPAALVKEGGWRCPACQGTVLAVPDRYVCFCGKRVNPEWDRYGVPHSCGEMCGRSRGASSLCVHRCNLHCHPGQCPPCSATVRRPCPCGKLTRQVRCSQEQEFSCGEVCDRLLNCEIHSCQAQCHANACEPCARIVEQKCYCGKQRREVVCSRESNASSEFSCGDECGRPLECGNHQCAKECHFGECGPCPLLPALVTHCPCGKSQLESIKEAKPRLSCSDPVPTCGETCSKFLQCGPKDSRHRCAAPCHEGPCPPCPQSSAVRCRCGATSRELPCVEVMSSKRQVPELCQRRCQKRRQCGRHKCLALCCVDAEHRCPLVCGKRLSCGQHVCEEPCHRGNCPSCWNVSFEDLSCHCGSATLSPPIACGTRPPECGQPCTREHPCGHPVTHTCHSDATCPPCAALTEKWCFGHHEKRRAVPCFLEGLSCGRPCLRDLPCGQHQCQQTCHQGECPSQGSAQACSQPCTTPRPSCGHPCGEPCHSGTPCPSSSTCRTLVSISCECGRRSEKLPCGSSEAQQPGFHQLSASLLASTIQEIQMGESVDISRVVNLSRARASRLDCDEECAVLERNRRLASALQIQNADVSNRVGPPSYSEFLKDEARKNPSFMLSVHQSLTQLVQTARQSKQKFRSHCFPVMNREQRRAVHELAEFFGCETQSYDQEPFRNVVVSAYKDRCRIPSGSVVAVVQRETACTPQRKGPAPLPQSRKRINTVLPLSTPLPLTSSLSHSAPAAQPEVPPSSSTLDYFNYDS